MSVYILHFEQSYFHARHYVGYSKFPIRRLERHLAWNEQALIVAVKKAGIRIHLARVWPDADKSFERKLKNRKHTARYCPLCRAQQGRGEAANP